MSFVAISTVKYPLALKDKIHSFGLSMIPIAKKQSGFISISFHQSNSRCETMMYWEWEKEDNHEACMQSKDWEQLMSVSGVLFQTDGVEFEVETRV